MALSFTGSLESTVRLSIDDDKEKTDFAYQIRRAAMAENTKRAYSEGWHCFAEYCRARDIEPLDASPEVTTDFFVNMARRHNQRTGKRLAIGTLVLYRCAIRKHFVTAAKVSPTHHPDVTELFKGLTRTLGTRQRQVRALREHHIKAILSHCPDTPIGHRDAAVIAVGFAAALRRSEICSLQLADLEWIEDEGDSVSKKLFINIRRSKTDQAGLGQRVAVPAGEQLQPLDVLERWLQTRGYDAGYLFQSFRRGGNLTGRPLHHSDVPRLVKRYVATIGLDSDEFSAHSLRAGFVTSAAAHHARLDKIMAVTRHSNPTTVMKYIRDVDAFDDHAGEGFL